MESLQLKRWMRALGLARILFQDEGYFTKYLDEIEDYIREREAHGEQMIFAFTRESYHKRGEQDNDSPKSLAPIENYTQEHEAHDGQLEFDFRLKKGE